MFRTRALALAAVASTALALTACGSDSLSEGDASATPEASTSAPTVDEALVAKLPESIKSAGVIKIGTDATYQPNEFLDADGKTVAVQKGTVQADVDLPARQKAFTDAGKPEINVLVDADQAKVTASVQSGKADAMLVDLPPAIAAVDLTGGQLELLGEQYDSAPYGYVLKKEDTAFGEAIVEALKQLESEGTYLEILTKWKTEGGAINDFAVNPTVS